jgi:UDP-N-acetylmuramoyl-L-alanyl-D-glutamate--2,6-diaminopimelate ligase
MTVLRPDPVPVRLDACPVPGVRWESAQGASATGITNDSRAVQPGDIYAALPGARSHGMDFASAALEAGAVAVLADTASGAAAASLGVPWAVVPEPRQVLGELSRWVYGDPGADLLLLGITGTNGKTTTSYLVEGGLSAAGHRTGIIGTTGIWIDDQVVPSARTTPEAPDVHALLAVMRQRGVTAAVMEVSSHALVMGRVDGLVFDVALFTNLSQDHLDFHGTMEAYFEAKASLFTPQRARRAVINVDDEWGVRLAGSTPLPKQTYGLANRPSPAAGPDRGSGSRDWTGWRVEPTPNGHLAISVAGPAGAATRLESPLPGMYNAANAVGAYVTLLAAGIGPDHARQGLLLARSVPGRMERVGSGSAFPVFVDYAHTPDAVQRVIAAARDLAAGKVVVVLGCGGDRDRQKRPLMGEIASTAADRLVITDDNPRSEDPAAIRAEVLAGVPDAFASRVTQEGDRREAIRTAIAGAGPGDVVLVLGKGHEQGQEAGGTITPFDDRTEVLDALRAPGVARMEDR